MEKHELDTLIKRRFNEGKTLSIHRITDEIVPWHVIGKAADKHYGGWKDAKKVVCGILSATHIKLDDIDRKCAELTQAGLDITQKTLGKPYYQAIIREFGSLNAFRESRGMHSSVRRWTEEDVLTEVLAEIDAGSTLGDINKNRPDLYAVVLRKYVSFGNFTKNTGITVPRSSNRKYTDEQLSEFVKTSVELGLSGAKAKESDDKLFNACRKRWGTWNKTLIANGIEPTRKSPRKDWTKDEIKQIYLEEIQSGISRGNVSNTHAIRKHFGGVTQLRVELGLDKTEEEKTLLSRISIDCYMNQILKMDVDNVNEQLLDELDVNLTHSIKHYYGSTSNYFSIIDIDRYKKPYTPFTWTKENVVWQLERWIREGYPVNYTAIQSRHKGIIVASRRLFGSYKKAFEYAGLNYEDYRIDSAMASRQGAEFEKVVAEILAEIGVEYIREPSINGCHPDFVIGKHWVDAKLSEWTVSFADCATMHKYLPHCRRLTIVYLRKLKDETVRTNELGVDLIHVSELLKELTEEKAQYYQRKLDAIMDVLKENAA